MNDDLTLTFISEVCRIKTRKNQGFQIMNFHEVLNQSEISLFDENNNKKLYIVQKKFAKLLMWG